MRLPQWYSEFVEKVDAALDDVMPGGDVELRALHEAMRYSVFPGGKRIRPAMVRASCSAVARVHPSCHTDAVIWPSVALELVHCYSLIHDDLPCMDDDDYRRGKPSCHKAYGEAVALLAGDALLTLAFEVLTSNGFVDVVGPDATCSCVQALASAAGGNGMIGGQVLDISPWPWPGSERVDSGALCRMEMLKTGKLFECAAEMGGIVGGANAEELGVVCGIAADIGLAFQIRDDLEDADSQRDSGRSGFLTAVSVWGIDGARRQFAALMDSARTKCAVLGEAASELTDIIDIVDREW
ncbi:MAG: polyprenyl synthetase family protein [Bacillota bacterium]